MHVLIAGVLGFVTLTAIVAAFFTVEQRIIGLVQRLDKTVREAGPGFRVKIPFIEKVASRVSLRVQQLDVEIETMTELYQELGTVPEPISTHIFC